MAISADDLQTLRDELPTMHPVTKRIVTDWVRWQVKRVCETEKLSPDGLFNRVYLDHLNDLDAAECISFLLTAVDVLGTMANAQ